MLDMKRDRFVAQLVNEVRLPIPLQALRIEPVEHALQHREWHRREELEGRGPEGAQGFEYFIRLFKSPGMTPNDTAHLFQVQIFRKRRSRRNGKKREEAIHLFRHLD